MSTWLRLAHISPNLMREVLFSALFLSRWEKKKIKIRWSHEGFSKIPQRNYNLNQDPPCVELYFYLNQWTWCEGQGGVRGEGSRRKALTGAAGVAWGRAPGKGHSRRDPWVVSWRKNKRLMVYQGDKGIHFLRRHSQSHAENRSMWALEQANLVWTVIAAFSSCVTLGRSLNFSGLHFRM